VTVARLSCGLLRRKFRMRRRAVGYWRSPWSWMASPVWRRRARRAWIAKPFVTGCIATMSSGVDGLVDRSVPGPTPKLTAAQMAELRSLVVAGPDPKTHQVMRWRCIDLRDEVARRFSVTVDERTVGNVWPAPSARVILDGYVGLHQRIRSQGHPWPRWISARPRSS
jgi:hypothetical protein